MKGSDLLIETRVNNELVKQLYKRACTFISAETLGTIIFPALMWEGINHKYLLYWFIYNILVLAFSKGIAYAYYLKQKNNQPMDIDYWNKLFIFAMFLSGTVWGYAGLLFPYVTNEIYNFIIFIVLLTVAGTANAELFENKTAYLVFVTPIYLVLLFLSISHYSDVYTVIFVATLIYITFATVITGKSSDVLKKALFLRFKHKELLEYLSIAGVELNQANKKLKSKIQIRRKAEKLLLDLATHDYLTKLPNRNVISTALEGAFALSKRNKTLVSLFFIDLDRFKKVNDKYGHKVGDDLLVELAKRLQLNVRRADMIVRFGGDEFCIIFNDIKNIDEIKLIANKICNEISKPFFVDDHEISISASIGIGIYPNDSSDIDSLFKIADIALYWAKKSGRNNYKIFEE